MNKKIRKPIRRDVRKLGEGVNTFKKRHLLREAPDDIEYSVENADWTENHSNWEKAKNKLSKLLTPKEYRMLMLDYTENRDLIDTILDEILISECTPRLFKWVVDSVTTGDLLYYPADDASELFDYLNFSESDFPEYDYPEYFDYEGWLDDFENGDISDNNGFEIYETSDGSKYAIDTDFFIISDSDTYRFLRGLD